MRKIIRSQLYQLRFNRITIILFLALIAFGIAQAFIEMNIYQVRGEILTGGDYVALGIEMQVIVALFFVVVCTAQTCFGDFVDKTTNYELMSGHMRWQVFWGRVITTLVVTVLGTIVVILTPAVVVTAINGWGTKLDIGGILIRLMLMILPIIRYSCELVLMGFIVKNPYVVMAGGYLYFAMGMQFHGSDSLFLASTNLTALGRVEVWNTFGLDSELNYIYDTGLDYTVVIGTIVVSLAVGLGSLLLGYIFFKKDDQN